MKLTVLIIIINIFISVFLYGQNATKDDIRVTSTFGEFRGDHFHNGVDFGGSDKEITPAKDGEIVFYFDQATDPTK